MKRITALISALTFMAASSLFLGTSALAQENSQFDEVISRLQDNDVPESQINILIEKLESGEDWDMLSGADPVSTEVRTVNGFNETIERYTDGSYVIYGIENAIPGNSEWASILAVGNCRSHASGSGFRTAYDCQAYESTPLFALGFYISYTLGQGGFDYIIEAYAPYGQAYAGTLNPQPPKLKVGQKKETATSPAWAQISTQFTATNNSKTRPLSMTATVGKDKATTYWTQK